MFFLLLFLIKSETIFEDSGFKVYDPIITSEPINYGTFYDLNSLQNFLIHNLYLDYSASISLVNKLSYMRSYSSSINQFGIVPGFGNNRQMFNQISLFSISNNNGVYNLKRSLIKITATLYSPSSKTGDNCFRLSNPQLILKICIKPLNGAQLQHIYNLLYQRMYWNYQSLITSIK